MTDRIPVFKDPNCPSNTAYLVDLFSNEIDDASCCVAAAIGADMYMVRGPLIETKPVTWRDNARRKYFAVRSYFRRLWDALLNRSYDDDA